LESQLDISEIPFQLPSEEEELAEQEELVEEEDCTPDEMDESFEIPLTQTCPISGFSGEFFTLKPETITMEEMDKLFQFPKVNDLPSINERFDYTTFVQFQKDRELNPYYPFKTETDYEIGMYIQRYHIGVNQGNDLIKLFRKVAPNIQLEFTNMKDLEEIWKKAPNVKHGFHNLGPEFNTEYTKPLIIRFFDPLQSIAELLLDPYYKGKQKFSFVEANRKKDREFGDLFSGYWMEYIQSRLPSGASTIPCIVYSDETVVTVIGNKKYHPVYISLGTIDQELRQELRAWKLLCYIPILDITPQEAKLVQFQLLKQKVFNASLKHVLKPLLDLSTKGIYLKDAESVYRPCFPMFCYFQTDWPEGKFVNGTKDGNKTPFPCGTCLVPNFMLHSLSEVFIVRTSKHMKFAYEKANLMSQQPGQLGKSQSLLKKLSLRPVQSFFLGIPGLNIFLQIAPDLLHQIHLGVTKKLLELTFSYLEYNKQKSKIEEIEKLFRAFDHPDLKTLKDVTLLTNLTAAEYEQILFELPFTFQQAKLAPVLVQSCKNLLHWYLGVINRRYTIRDLTKLSGICKELEKNLRFLQPFCKSKLNLAKLHFMIHYPVFMVMFESASVAQTNAGEHNHGSFVKNPWRQSNHRNPEEWMLRALEKDHAYLLTKGAEQKKSKRVRRNAKFLEILTVIFLLKILMKRKQN